MTKIPGSPVLPITPTVDDDHNPTTCMACGRIALGLGRAIKKGGKMIDPGFLCKGCVVAVHDLSKMDRLSVFELQALDAGVESVGEYIEENGGITDLAHMDELGARMLVKAAWEGCIRGVRSALKEAPF
ncbi:DUF6511 domain-containing protein [Rhizobium sp.]|uniref:DUF6511 domain-containing protein n=1 Tax=Rhizobium sp. TaxID=391 RepID=UPI00289CF965